MRFEGSAHGALEHVAPAERGHLDHPTLRAWHVRIRPEAPHGERLEPGRTRQEQRATEAGVRNGGSIDRIGVGLIGRPPPDLIRPCAGRERDQLPDIDRRWQQSDFGGVKRCPDVRCWSGSGGTLDDQGVERQRRRVE